MSAFAHPRGTRPDLSRTDAFNYALPEGRIARYPAERRDASRLLVVPRGPTGDGEGRLEVPPAPPELAHLHFFDLPSLLARGDLLVLNESRVLPVRLIGIKPTGARCEVLLLRPVAPGKVENALRWEALVRPGAKLKPGRRLVVSGELTVVIEEGLPDGGRIVRLETAGRPDEVLEKLGRIPLPPYLEREDEPLDRERYQTVYAREPGSVAAPTAGLHFTPELLEAIEAGGVGIARVTLHVGPGTFRPVESENSGEHRLHRESWRLPPETARAITETRARGGRIWAVGTTVVRTLEGAADPDGTIRAGSGETELFIRPGHRFRIVDALITNFHLPRSTLLMLVAAFAGYRTTMLAYEAAIGTGYRFYSYGDAMVVTPAHREEGE
ncbi:MAG: tRNA preQ1(34) S-adenosylmethionine ribosyltransferase-isomerase QueA [Gemmatimonadota bacterium]